MAPSNRTMNVWPPLILAVSLFPLSIRPIIKLLRLYRQNENVFERLLLEIAWPRPRISPLSLSLSLLLFRVSTYRLNKDFIGFISLSTRQYFVRRKKTTEYRWSRFKVCPNDFNHYSWNCWYLPRRRDTLLISIPENSAVLYFSIYCQIIERKSSLRLFEVFYVRIER